MANVISLRKRLIEVRVHILEAGTTRVIDTQTVYVGPFQDTEEAAAVDWAHCFSRRANAVAGRAYWVKTRVLRVNYLTAKHASYCADPSADPNSAGIGFALIFEEYLRQRFPSRYRQEQNPL